MLRINRSFMLVAALFLICLTLPRLSFSQDEIDVTFNNRMNYVFGRLEKNKVPYGLLRDYAFEFTNLNAFSGASMLDSNYVDYTTLSDIYNTLVTTRIHTNATGLIGPAAWDSLWYSQRKSNVITLSGLFFNYARFRDDALSTGKLTISSEQFVDRYVSGTWQNPYQSERVFALAPSTDYYAGKNLQVLLPSNLWLTNGSSSVVGLSIDMSDGLGYRTLTPGQPINVNYSDTGRKEWKFRLYLTGGTYLYSHSSVYIKVSPYDESAMLSKMSIINHIPGEGIERRQFTASRNYLGRAAQGSISIHYANADRIIRRPLIVAEGFDEGHITQPENWWGSQGIENFMLDARNDGNTALRNLLIEPTPQYDLIYVDWGIGTDFIQRNALLLEDIVRWVNSNKQPLGGVLQPNVIIGLSMGGLITRWALRDMENNNENHQTRLFISYDSPHQGANVPLGYQYMYRHARSLYIQTGIAPFVEIVQVIRNRVSPLRTLNISNTPAARQMLINYVNDNNQVDNSIHNQWQSDLRSMGYPNRFGIRVVAISNGSECAITQPYSPGAALLNYSGKSNTRVLSDMILSFTSLGHNTVFYTSFLTGQPAFLLGFVPGKNEIKFEFTVNVQPNQGSSRLYRGTISYKKTWLWAIPIQVTITNRSFFASPATLPYDYYPGGQINDGINLQSSSLKNWLLKYNVSASHIQTFSFVPVTSALDIGGGNITLAHNDYLSRYVGGNPPIAPRNTPFHNFITAFNVATTINNENHIDILRRNGDWVADELNIFNPIANCSFVCNSGNLSISGPATVCDNQVTYNLNNAPAGVGWVWSTTPAGIVNITPSPGGTQATVTRISNGNFTLRAEINSINCGSLAINSSIIRAGSFANEDYPPMGPYEVGCSQYVSYTTGQEYLGATYNWTWPNDWTYISGQGTRILNLMTPFHTPAGGSYGTISISLASVCDPGGTIPAIVWVRASCDIYYYVVAPNPASSTINIKADEKKMKAKVAPSDITGVNIYDQQGTLKIHKTYNKVKQVSVDISSLSAGIHFVEIVSGTHKERKQLSIVK